MADSNSSSHPKEPKTYTRTRTRIQRRLSRLDSSEEPTRKARGRRQRRQFKDQQSLNQDECLEKCQEQGFHWDDDLRIRNQAYLGDASSKPLRFHARPSSVNSSHSASLKLASSSAEHERAGRHQLKYGRRNEKTSQDKFSRNHSTTHTQITDLEELPHGHPFGRPQSRQLKPRSSLQSAKCTRYPCSDLSEVTIPSPLLYHKRSRQALTNFLEDNLNLKCKECQEGSSKTVFDQNTAGNTSDKVSSIFDERCMARGLSPSTPSLLQQHSTKKQAEVGAKHPEQVITYMGCPVDRFQLPPIVTTTNCYRYTCISESRKLPESRNLSNATVVHSTDIRRSASNDQIDVARPNPLYIPDFQYLPYLVNKEHLDQGGEQNRSRRADVDFDLWNSLDCKAHARSTSGDVSFNPTIFVNANDMEAKLSANTRSHCSCSDQLVEPPSDSCTLYQLTVCDGSECLALVPQRPYCSPCNGDTTCSAQHSRKTLSQVPKHALSENEGSMACVAQFWSHDLGLDDHHAEGCTNSNVYKHRLAHIPTQLEEASCGTSTRFNGSNMAFFGSYQGDTGLDTVILRHEDKEAQSIGQEPISKLDQFNGEVSSDEWEDV